MPGKYQVQNPIIQQAPTFQAAKTTLPPTNPQESSQITPQHAESQGRWSEQENLRFCIFVHYFQQIFASKHKRKTCKIFKTFAQYLTSRSPTQCRSHFQKMMEKHHSITKMKKYYKDLQGEKEYRKFYEKFREEWEAHHEPISKSHPQIRQFKQFAIQTEPILPTQAPCNCTRNHLQAESHIQSSQIASFPFWSENTHIQPITPGGLFLWIPNHPILPSHSRTVIQS